MDRPVIGITMGDPAGIGPEICAKAVTSREIQSVARCIVIGDSGVLRLGLQAAKIKGIDLHPLARVSDALFQPKTIDLFDLNNVDLPRLKLGQVSKMAGRAAF
ncbi:MAG: 4-hydroxythreonine-4-phosphate dehydrogenase PdxA, partial [Candidatus Margulisbacteria bacterium]|nr:4-hydroxythreonine-4-phosphate dehydrogenase PdxA [Candidatus Margulisiibacteriota bacterium]